VALRRSQHRRLRQPPWTQWPSPHPASAATWPPRPACPRPCGGRRGAVSGHADACGRSSRRKVVVAQHEVDRSLRRWRIRARKLSRLLHHWPPAITEPFHPSRPQLSSLKWGCRPREKTRHDVSEKRTGKRQAQYPRFSQYRPPTPRLACDRSLKTRGDEPIQNDSRTALSVRWTCETKCGFCRLHRLKRVIPHQERRQLP